MRVLEAGHVYIPELYDDSGDMDELDPLVFFKRIGDNYPFNEGEPHSGTNCQDICRILINRIKYLNMQKEHPNNQKAIDRLRHVIWLFEDRHAQLKGRTLKHPDYLIEEVRPCQTCGHIECEEHPQD